MSARAVFWGSGSSLRTGWALALFATALAALGTPVTVLVARVPLHRLSGLALAAWGLAGVSVLATWLLLRVERREWAYAGWGVGTGRAGLSGLVEGAGLAVLAAAVCWVGGQRWVWPGGSAGAWVTGAAALLVALAGAALFEELAFRGYPLRRAMDAWPPWLVLGGFAAAFAGLHGWNPDLGVLAFANITLAGLWLGVAFWRRGSLPLVWGLHLGWNWAQVAAFGFEVSGVGFGAPGPRVRAYGHEWLTGGGFGPEGGVAGTVAMGVGLIRWLLVPPRREGLAA